MDFTISTEEVNESTEVIRLTGELDLYNAPEFKQHMTAAIETGKTEVVIDLTGVAFIDSTTLGVLMGGVKRMRPEGGDIRIVCPEGEIAKIFEITGLDRLFSLYETRADALATAPSP